MRIADIKPYERPREKAVRDGVGSLSDVELLALLIGSGVRGKNALEIAASLLYSRGGISGLSQAGFRDLSKEKGVSKALALRLAASFELSRRSEEMPPFGAFSEEVWLFAFSKAKRPLGRVLLYKGGADRVQVDPREVARAACALGASSVLLVHTHPSGVAYPSSEDLKTTVLVCSFLSELGIRMLDHIVKSPGQSFSMKGNGFL